MKKQIPRSSEMNAGTVYALNWLREYVDAAVAAGGGTTTTVTMGGDISGLSNAAVIVSGAVTNAKMANMATATFKGRVTAGTGVPEDLSGTQATTLLDTFTTALKGLAPASGGGTANFLRADGTWAVPPGTTTSLAMTGDVGGTTSANTIGANKVTNAMLSQVTAPVFHGRTTAGLGNVENLTATQATAMLDVFTTVLKGLVPSGGSATTYLRGDGTWQTIAGGGDMLKSDNLLGLTNYVTARSNLGLGALATLVPPGTTTTFLRGDSTYTAVPSDVLFNSQTSAQLLGTADTYVSASAVNLGGRQKAGTVIRWRLYMTKTAAGVAAGTITCRIGTAGTTADVAVATLTLSAQTAATDQAWVDVECIIRAVGAAGVGAAVATFMFVHNGTTTGFASVAQPVINGASNSATVVTSGSGVIAGISMNGGASSAWTVSSCSAMVYNIT